MATSTAPSETIPTSTLADPQSTSLQPPISSSDSVNNNVIAGLSVPRGPDGLPVNLSEVSALPARDMVSLINEFVVSTAQFLNRFARLCDKRLAKVSSTVDRIEITMAILETKLASIPELSDGTAPAASTTSISSSTSLAPPALTQPTPSEVVTLPPPEATPSESTPSTPPPPPSQPTQRALTNREDPRYAEYFRLLRLGVVPQSIKQKMVAMGLDPSVIDNPDGPSGAMVADESAGASAPASTYVSAPVPAPAPPPPPPPAATSTPAPVQPPPTPVQPPVQPPAPVPDLMPPPPMAEKRLLTNREDPRFAEFFKMLRIGVLPQNIKGKMAAMGYDTSILDRPDAPSDNQPPDAMPTPVTPSVASTPPPPSSNIAPPMLALPPAQPQPPQSILPPPPKQSADDDFEEDEDDDDDLGGAPVKPPQAAPPPMLLPPPASTLPPAGFGSKSVFEDDDDDDDDLAH